MKLISLSGGLGNQLFQYAVALNSRESLELEWKLGFASENHKGEPEICSYQLPAVAGLSTRRRPTRFEIRVHHWLLVVGASKSNVRFFIEFPLRVFSSVVLRKYFGRFVIPNIPRSLGYDPKFNPEEGNFLVGFFHTYKWVEDPNVLLQMKALEIRNPSDQLVTLMNEVSKKSVLIVHIRLGDYEKESNLGILSKKYYREAIEKIHEIREFHEIWVFSNDEKKSRTIFPQEWTFKSRWITEVDDSAAETLRIMRTGQGYILGNSTYSWWAAMLTSSENPLIIAPAPWFKIAATPNALIPPDWITIPSDFLSQERGSQALESQE